MFCWHVLSHFVFVFIILIIEDFTEGIYGGEIMMRVLVTKFPKLLTNTRPIPDPTIIRISWLDRQVVCNLRLVLIWEGCILFRRERGAKYIVETVIGRKSWSCLRLREVL